ncbi:metallopeptidase TldD-related protein [Cryptosporangium phraense]|uniref:TldD/PmbA family protein n=1 Tax=Cryptosporangium phraense TaxID=2593070 RepID=A0A545AR85_9ACTN|nr:metallopeptidase TldD-related protein [Cryptosporangium phraense]TQS43850.1 TldD/PmbA family protein [Cryptosporangium phraense]
MTSQNLVEQALSLSKSDGCIVIAGESTSANLRWATNTLTTNGVMRSRSITVISTVGTGTGVASGAVSRTAVSSDELEALVRASEETARSNGAADDAQPLVAGGAASDWDAAPSETSIEVFSSVAPALGDAFDAARSAGRLLYGFVEHEVDTYYLGSSTGLRLRHVQPQGHIGITGKVADDLSRSAWVGQATRDFSDVSVESLDASLAQRLEWSARKVSLEPGRYDTVLPPTAVADLMIYAYWNMGARSAFEGRTVFSRPGAGTRVGERLTPHPVTLRSDASFPGLESAPFVLAQASSGTSSVFDNGLALEPTDWIRDGELRALMQTRHSAGITGLPVTPMIGNLVMEVGGASGGLDALVGGVERGLLLTCLWYIREVDPQTLLLTGLTRDGVYLVEGGEVVGAVNNFRFNESPVDLLSRFSGASETGAAFSREWGDYFHRTAMPALRVPDFNMSSVSPAS